MALAKALLDTFLTYRTDDEVNVPAILIVINISHINQNSFYSQTSQLTFFGYNSSELGSSAYISVSELGLRVIIEGLIFSTCSSLGALRQNIIANRINHK